VVNHNKVILAEFGYDGSVLETFPVDQRVPRRLMFYLTAYVMPLIYWKLLLRSTALIFPRQIHAGKSLNSKFDANETLTQN